MRRFVLHGTHLFLSPPASDCPVPVQLQILSSWSSCSSSVACCMHQRNKASWWRTFCSVLYCIGCPYYLTSPVCWCGLPRYLFESTIFTSSPRMVSRTGVFLLFLKSTTSSLVLLVMKKFLLLQKTLQCSLIRCLYYSSLLLLMQPTIEESSEKFVLFRNRRCAKNFSGAGAQTSISMELLRCKINITVEL